MEGYNEGEEDSTSVPVFSSALSSCGVQRKARQVMGSNPAKVAWFDLKVFYVRLSCCPLDGGSSPEYLTVRLAPKNPETTAVEVNGGRVIFPSTDGKGNYFSLCLRRNRVDEECEEATFVSTDNVRTAGTLQFQVCDHDDVLICGNLELYEGVNEGNKRGWAMDCHSAVGPANCGLLRGKRFILPPAVEVYVAGSFSGAPVILSKIVQLFCWRKTVRRATLDAIPEYECTEKILESNLHTDQLSEERDYEELDEKDEESLRSFYSSGAYVDGDDGELSWFNAGVRVGVGIGLGMCLGVGIGVGLLVRTYQSTTRNFRKRLF